MTQEAQPITAEYHTVADSVPQTVSTDLSRYYGAGYFESDTLLHPEQPYRPDGISGTPLPYHLWSDNWITVLLLACSVLFIFLVRGTYRRFANITKGFFFPSRNSYAEEVELSKVGTWTTLGFVAELCLCGGLLTYIYIHRQDIAHADYDERLYAGIGIYAAAIGVYFLVKTFLYDFVNWVFFDRGKSVEWKRSNSYIICVESLILMPVTVFTIHPLIPFEISFVAVVFTLVFAKLLLLYKALKIFYNRDYGILHIFLYLCTLEAVPLLVLLKFLTSVTIDTTVKI